MDKYSKYLNIIGIAGISFFILLSLLIYFHFIPTKLDSNIVFTVKKNTSINKIATDLKKHKIIKSKDFFKLYLTLSSKDTKIRAGHFSIPTMINQQQLIHILTTETGIYKLTKITIPEGYSIEQIDNVLLKKNLAQDISFKTFCHKQAKNIFKNEFKFLKDIPLNTIEGYLFPETYYFKPNESSHAIAKTMLKEFEKQIVQPFKLENDYTKNLNFHQLVTLASIIEKESKKKYEMPIISSVFHNRLKKRIRLESCPTVVYALGKSHKEKLYYQDLKVNSIYNTYRNYGLPPTPIASPGKKAFKAALHPDKTNYLYFVALANGQHHFSKTFNEHINAKNKQKKLFIRNSNI